MLRPAWILAPALSGEPVSCFLNFIDYSAWWMLQVDSVEGPMPQTRFVLKKALELGHRVVVVVNKVDRPSARVEYVINSTFELFCELDATDEQVRPRRQMTASPETACLPGHRLRQFAHLVSVLWIAAPCV